ncbi:equilibrative nucleoside transporter 3 [Arapaima gigas]
MSVSVLDCSGLLVLRRHRPQERAVETDRGTRAEGETKAVGVGNGFVSWRRICLFHCASVRLLRRRVFLHIGRCVAGMKGSVGPEDLHGSRRGSSPLRFLPGLTVVPQPGEVVLSEPPRKEEELLQGLGCLLCHLPILVFLFSIPNSSLSYAFQASVNSSYGTPVHSSINEEHKDEGLDEVSDSTALLAGDHPTRPLVVCHSPEDTYNLVYIIFFLLGIGSLLPWNFFTTAKHYWMYKLGNGSNPEDNGGSRSELSDYFESYLAIASTVPAVLCLVLNYLLVNRLSPSTRILSSLAVMLAVFALTTALVKVDVSGCKTEFFSGTLACVVLVNGASNVFSGSIFGISGHFPMRISQALISGQAMGGTLSAVAAIVDLAVAKDVTDSALAYFLTADIFTLLCIAMYLLLPKLEYSRHYMLAGTSNEVLGDEDRPPEPTDRVSIPPLKPILKKTWTLGFCVFYVFFISIIVFPAVSSGIQSVHPDSRSPWTTTYFVPLTSFFLYNAADFCGRQATAWLQAPGPTSHLMPILVLLRTVLVPLFMFCNYQPRDHMHMVLFTHDLFPVVFISLLGLSNGYLGTLPMIYGPKVVSRDLAEPTGVVMSFFLTLGLATGSAFSVLIVHCI